MSRRRDPATMSLVGAGAVAGQLQQLSVAALIHAKAWLAPVYRQGLVADLAGACAPVKPWSGRHLARWPARGASPGRRSAGACRGLGNALAFRPGHAWSLSTALGSPGLAVIGGHRDTHFAFLRDLADWRATAAALADGRRRAPTGSGALEIVDASRSACQPGAARSRFYGYLLPV